MTTARVTPKGLTHALVVVVASCGVFFFEMTKAVTQQSAAALSSPSATTASTRPLLSAGSVPLSFAAHSDVYGSFDVPVGEEDSTEVFDSLHAGSTILGASLNFTNSIVGAGCIGFGGAMAQSGGVAAIMILLFFAVLTKKSFDLIVSLGELYCSHSSSSSSYESLATAAFGPTGNMIVIVSKGVFTYGCLVAYNVIVKDNFAPAMQHLLPWTVFFSTTFLTCLVATTVILPLCLQRTMKPLERFSAIKLVAFISIILIELLLYLQLSNQAPDAAMEVEENSTLTSHWLSIREGLIPSMGTLVCIFVGQHTVNIVYQSLQPQYRNIAHFEQVSTLAIAMSFSICLPVGILAYITFWQQTSSNLLELYPRGIPVDMARLFLSIAISLTYPPAFFSLRQLIITSFAKAFRKWILDGSNDQLEPVMHHTATVLLWLSTLILALLAPSLGDVLNVIGCCTGTIIAFIFPGVMAVKFQGHWTSLSLTLVIVGGSIGCIGTYYSVKQLVNDLQNIS